MGNEIYNNVQDVSSLLPEFLSRFLFGESMLPDEYVLKMVDHLLSTAAVRFDDDRLAGIKVISSLNGQFLSAEQFEEPEWLNPPGYYQNGGYWPMFTLVALSLAYQALAWSGLLYFKRTLSQIKRKLLPMYPAST